MIDDVDQGDYTKIRLEELAIKKLEIEKQAEVTMTTQQHTLAMAMNQNKMQMLTMLLEKTSDLAAIEKMMTLMFAVG